MVLAGQVVPTSTRAPRLAIGSQAVLLGALAVLLSTGRWLADPAGFVVLAIGVVGIAVGGLAWQRAGQVLPLILVDVWYVAFALVIAGAPWSSCIDSCDPGPSELDPWRFIESLGGPLQFTSIVWLAAGAVGIAALVRSRR